MSTTGKIVGTYYVCMFMMDNNGQSKTLVIPVVYDRPSSWRWLGKVAQSSLLP